MDHRRVASTLGLVNIGLASFLVMLMLFPAPTATVSTFPFPPHADPTATPTVHYSYCLFPGNGKHIGFGNGFGHAGAKFLCETLSRLIDIQVFV